MRQRAAWFPVAAELVSAGFHDAGMCMCASRARMFRRKGLTVKIFMSLQKIKLYLNNKSITPYEPYSRIKEVIQLGTETEMVAYQQGKNN